MVPIYQDGAPHAFVYEADLIKKKVYHGTRHTPYRSCKVSSFFMMTQASTIVRSFGGYGLSAPLYTVMQ